MSSITISTNANLFINESCIIGNNEDNKVFNERGLFCHITITNCTLDSDIMISTRYLVSSMHCRTLLQQNANHFLIHTAHSQQYQLYQRSNQDKREIEVLVTSKEKMMCFCFHPNRQEQSQSIMIVKTAQEEEELALLS